MNIYDYEVQEDMGYRLTDALVEAIKIIHELATPEQLKNALDRIQSVLEQTK